MTPVDFLNKSRTIHGNKFNYSKSKYINSKTKIIITCRNHGDFEVIPTVHWRGQGGCKKCQYEKNVLEQSKTTEKFVIESKEIFGERFEYPNTNYINSKTNVTVVCREHGAFSVLPHVHLRGTAGGCIKCGYTSNREKQKITTKEFISRSIRLHGNKYDYSKLDYINNATPITLICPDHGEFICYPKNHLLKGTGCPVCGIGAKNMEILVDSKRNTLEWFLSKAKEIHGDKYDYSACTAYINGKTKMPILCPTHGTFNQHAEAHINSGYGCRKCYHDSRRGKGGGGYALEYFDRHPEKCDSPGILYIAHMEDKKDRFFKVGITSLGGVKERFYYKTKHGTRITPIHEHHTTLKEAFDSEQFLLQTLQPYRYFPNRKFAGYTECFKITPETIALVQDYFGINISIPPEEQCQKN